MAPLQSWLLVAGETGRELVPSEAREVRPLFNSLPLVPARTGRELVPLRFPQGKFSWRRESVPER